MGYTLIIAEKPDAALRIAQAIADEKPKIVERDGAKYYEFVVKRKKHVCVPAVGHLFVLDSTKDKNNKGWGYPVFDCEWVPTYTKKGTEWTRKYFENIKALAKGADEYIDAADVDNEGEVLLFNILRFICGVKDAKRMVFSTLTKDELIESYKNMKPHIMFPMVEAGLTRHYLDWLWGINTTRALTLALKSASERGFAILSSGRVQSPTLAILLERELEIRKFKPKPFWELELHVKIDGAEAVAAYEKGRIWKKEEADKILQACKGKDAVVKDVKKKKYRQAPPVPFNTTDLQTESYNQFGFSPTQTLNIAESLYQQGAISYPRSASQKLPVTVNYEKILKALALMPPYTKFCEELLAKEKLMPNEGPRTDPAHPCFPSYAKVLLNGHDFTTFKTISSKVKNWVWNEEKRSYFGKMGKPIKVFSYDISNKKIVSSEILGCWKTPSHYNSLIKITTSEGSNIELTPNHPIFTFGVNGLEFKRAEEFKKGDLVVIKKSQEKFPKKIILTKRKFINTFTKKQQEAIKKYYTFFCLLNKNLQKKDITRRLGISDATYYRWKNNAKKPTVVKTIEKAERLKLLPLKLNSPKALILARLLGHIFGDGHIGYRKQGVKEYPVAFFMVFKEDVEKIKDDIKSLQLTFSKEQKIRSIYSIQSSNTILTRLLIALGAPVGDKTVKGFLIPKWILNAPKTIKAEFLASYFGADMTKPRVHIKNPRDLRDLTIEMHKNTKFERNGIELFIQIKRMLREFKVKTSKVKILGRKKRVGHGDEISIIKISISNSRDNLLKFFSEIGYRYCEYKEKLARKCLAYLLMRKLLLNRRRSLREKARKLYKRLKWVDISRMLGISRHTIKGWIYYKKGSKEEHVPVFELPRFSDFNLEIPEGLSIVSIEKIDKIPSEEFVYDLEIKNSHTFFVSDVLVHNCIYATYEVPDLKKLTLQQKKIYDLIARRTLATFADPAIRESMKVVLAIDKNNFIASGKRTIEEGWIKFYEPYAKLKEQILPDLKVGQIIEVTKLELLEKETQPPSRYTQGSIIKELEEKNLGTKATRAEILQTLYDRGYISGKSIQVTKLGEAVAQALKRYCSKILSEELSRKFEEEMERVYKGERKREEVIEEAKRTLKEILEDFKLNEKKIGKKLLEALMIKREEERRLGTCPNCKTGELRILRSRASGKFFVGCSSYPNCKTGYPLPRGAMIQAIGKVCEKCNTPIIQVLRKGKRPFRMCLDPKCESKKDWGKKVKK